jgi:CPA1 family monovalent cation:H+ antiporter
MEITILFFFSIIFLLLISNFTFYLSKKIKFPYTLLLVLVGILLIPISKIPGMEFIREFHLSKDVLFYVFLPTLLFEAAYNIPYRSLLKNIKAISFMAVFGLLMSALITGFGIHYILLLFDINIPFIITFLFGAIISATDPVAVIALFKEYGAPKRLTLLFEGESLFNDGTAVALFSVILGAILTTGGVFDSNVITSGIITFISLIFLGIIFGLITGFLFSKALGLVKDNNIQITFALLSAHSTFILAEFISEFVKIGDNHIHISGIIATVISSLVIGNYGRYKMSPKTEEYTDKFWYYFAFIANSFVFLLLGLFFYQINFTYIQEFILPIIVGIFVVVVARMVSVYLSILPLNYFKLEREILPS